jgi:hypothetical protein
VFTAWPLKLTEDVAMNPVPLTVSVNCAAPAVVPVGVNEVIAGAGLLAAAPDWFTVKVSHPAMMVSVRGAPVVFWPTV